MDASRAIEVVDEIVCAFCEKIVLAAGEEVHEVTDGKRRRHVAPVCEHCWREDERNPGSLAAIMRWVRRTRITRFKVVDGDL